MKSAVLNSDNLGGHLVSINSQPEEQFVQDLVISEYGSSRIFWTGGKRSGTVCFNYWGFHEKGTYSYLCT